MAYSHLPMPPSELSVTNRTTHRPEEAYFTAPSSLKRSISTSLSPTTSRRISCVCSPSSGGGVLTRGLQAEYLTGGFNKEIVPQNGCCTWTTISRARTWAWFSVSRTSLTAAYGRPEPAKTASHSAVVFFTVTASMAASSASRCCTRSALVAYCEAVTHSGWPRPWQRLRKRRSLPAPNRMSPSEVLKERYGTMEACGDFP